jgi:hypothetical protein
MARVANTRSVAYIQSGFTHWRPKGEMGEDFDKLAHYSNYIDPPGFTAAKSARPEDMATDDDGPDTEKHDGSAKELRKHSELDRISETGARERADLPSWAEAARAESERRQRKFALATHQLRTTAVVESYEWGRHFRAEGGFSAPKPAEGFAVASKGSRLSKADLKKKRTLLAFAGAIRDAIARNDKRAAGEFLLEAKPIVGHGNFMEWAEKETGLTARTCRTYMEMATAKA